MSMEKSTTGTTTNSKIKSHISISELISVPPPITEVWHIAYFWVSYGRSLMPGSPMGQSEALSR